MSLDDDEGTNDSQTGANVQGRWFVIKLGDVGPNGSAIKRLGGVGPACALGNNRFTALRSLTIPGWPVGKNAGNPTCDGSIHAGWTRDRLERVRRVPVDQPAAR